MDLNQALIERAQHVIPGGVNSLYELSALSAALRALSSAPRALICGM